MSGRRTVSSLIAGLLALIVLLSLPAIFWQAFDCPECETPRRMGFMDLGFHFCSKGKVSFVQRWKMKREIEGRQRVHP